MNAPRPIDHKVFVANFIKQMNEQDNRSTATPYFYQIEDYEYIPSYHEDEWDRLVAGKDGEVIAQADDVESIVYELLELDDFTLADLQDENGDLIDSRHELDLLLAERDIQLYSQKITEVYKGCFFTETDAKNHLTSNAHHYSSKARTYIQHCWRAPELEQFFKSVGELVGVGYQSK